MRLLLCFCILQSAICSKCVRNVANVSYKSWHFEVPKKFLNPEITSLEIMIVNITQVFLWEINLIQNICLAYKVLEDVLYKRHENPKLVEFQFTTMDWHKIIIWMPVQNLQQLVE